MSRVGVHRKVGFKARSGRHRSAPVPHKGHHGPTRYSRVGRLLKQRVALALAPRIEDFDHDFTNNARALPDTAAGTNGR